MLERYLESGREGAVLRIGLAGSILVGVASDGFRVEDAQLGA